MNHPSLLLLFMLPAVAWGWRRRAERKYALAAGTLLALLAVVLGQTTAPVPPFATTPAVVGYDYPGETIYVRQPDTGAYAQLQFAAFAPFGLLGSAASLAQVISGAVKFTMNAPAGSPGVGPASQVLALADFTGDDSPGIAVAGQIGRNYSSLTINEYTRLFLFRGAQTFSIGPSVAGGLDADLNRDGKPDLAVAYQGSTSPGAVDIFLNNGDGSFANPVKYTAGSAPTSMATLDVNHDGGLDLVAGNGRDQTASPFLGAGRGGFQLVSTYVASYGPNSLIPTSFNGKGNLDLIQGSGEARGTLRNCSGRSNVPA